MSTIKLPFLSAAAALLAATAWAGTTVGDVTYSGDIYTWCNTNTVENDLAYGPIAKSTYSNDAYSYGDDISTWDTGNTQIKALLANGGGTSFTSDLNTLRIDSSKGSNTKIKYTFGPLTLGGLIVETGATGYYIKAPSVNAVRTIYLGNGTATPSVFTINESIELNDSATTGDGNIYLQGALTMAIASGKTFTLTPRTTVGATLLSGAVLTMTGDGSLAVGTKLTANGTLDFSNLDVSRNTPYIQGNLVVTGSTKFRFPSGLEEGKPYTLCSGTLTAPRTTMVATARVGGVEESVKLTVSSNTVSYATSDVFKIWTGNGGNNLWATAGNWSGNAVPTTNDVVKITNSVEVVLTTDDVAPAGVVIADDVTLTINGAGTIGGVSGGNLVKKGEGVLNIVKNDEGYSINGTKVTIEEGSIGNPYGSVGTFKNLDLTIASGATITCGGWATCEGTMTVNCGSDVTAFKNTGNDNSMKLSGLTSFTKKGAGTLTMKAALENTTVNIEEGKLILDNKNVQSSSLTVSGAGALELTSDVYLTGITFSNFTGTLTGTGTITYSGSLPTDSALLSKIQSADWTGAVKIENKTGLINLNLNNYGNKNSKVILSGVAGYFVNASSTHHEIKPTIELVDGSYGFGLKVTDGISTDWVQFDKITGSGTYILAKPNGAPRRRHFFPDVTDFTGSFVLQTTGNISTIYIGKDWTGYVNNNNAHDCNIFVAGDVDANIGISNEAGKIIINEGVTATMNSARRWTAATNNIIYVAGTLKSTSVNQVKAYDATNRIEVASSGVLEMVTTANQDDTYAVFTNITGTGTIKYSGKGYHTLPAYSTNIWANTLGVCIEQTDGMLLMLNGTANEPFVYEIGSLSGTKDIRVDWTDVANSRSLRVTQATNTTWSGKIMPCTASGNRDRFNSLIVAGVAGATNTLTISGTSFDSQCSNNLVVAETGSVKLTGNWVGDVTVDGILSGTGTASGTITFNSKGKLLCTPGETICLGKLAAATGVSAINVAIPEGTELTEARYTLMTFKAGPEIPSFTFVNAADYPMYKLVKTSEGLKLTKSGFTISVR